MANLWDITNRPSTKTKLELIRKIFHMWLTVWTSPNQQSWIDKELYVIDLFAGKGSYTNSGYKVSGSSLIFLEEINSVYDRLAESKIKIKLFSIEKNRNNWNELNDSINKFIKANSKLNEVVKCEVLNGDCNVEIDKVLSSIKNTPKNPLFVLVDPTGLQIKRPTVEKIVNLHNRKDIMFNYILEGIRRTAGVANKKNQGKNLSIKEIKTVKTLMEFLGEDVNIIKDDIKLLMNYVEPVFLAKNISVVGYDVSYPNRNDTLYYLLFASRKVSITNIVKDIYARQKENTYGKQLFGKEGYMKSLFTAQSSGDKVVFIKRKSLLYRTKVEYGDWTINHVLGCAHGCNFPCYAMMMAKRFGWVKDYEDWRKPRIASNALEILSKEIPKYKKDIKFVHLSFMTDPFMYDSDTGDLIPEIKNLTLNIIHLLNENGIKVTVLTKGFYPEDIQDRSFSKENEYGITLVSLNEKFKNKFEPYSAPYKKRIQSLYNLHEAGFKTWVSIEPYPTPNLDDTAENIDLLLDKVSFVDKIVFGKINYNVKSRFFEKNEEFYRKISDKVISFCEKRGIKCHIKHGTPHNKEDSEDFF